MTSVRESIPADDQYLRALGRAIYNFAYLEWGIIWLVETLERDFLSRASKMTATKIADEFTNTVQRVPTSEDDRIDLVQLAADFKILVTERDKLVHGNPFTAERDQQRFFYSGRHGQKDWTEELIHQFSDKAATLSSQAGHLLHGSRYERWRSKSGRQSS